MSLLSIDDAFERLDQMVQPLQSVCIPLSEALHRVTAEPVEAFCDLPLFDQSAMDGYALKASDVDGLPKRLPLGDLVAAGGHDELPRLKAGHACRIFTGGLIPIGADAVVRQEWTSAEQSHVTIERPTPPGQDLRRRGEELRQGTRLIGAGVRMGSGHIAMLAMAGIAEVTVRRAPRIHVLVTGDEVIDAGQVLRPGEVFNANGPLIQSWLAASGYLDVCVKHVADTEAAVAEALSFGFAEADLVLSSGGVSVGDRDLIAPIAESLGAKRAFWKVAQKPGKPLYVASKGSSVLVGLPGNPGSVLVNVATFVRRALDLLEAKSEVGPDFQRAVLGADITPDRQRECWVRVRRQIDDRGVLILHPQGKQASHMLSNLAAADAMVRVPAAAETLLAGSIVTWTPVAIT